MILGPSNVCSTYLELSLCLNELNRVIRPGGFIYIADFGFQPCIGFGAQCLDLDLFISKGSREGLPIGTILAKRIVKDECSVFDEIYTSNDIQRVRFHPSRKEKILNCNLFFDKERIMIKRFLGGNREN